jgi:hypothetical protein
MGCPRIFVQGAIINFGGAFNDKVQRFIRKRELASK